jgi:ankyrin repeat protein
LKNLIFLNSLNFLKNKDFVRSELDEFLYRRDQFGNTALHMAVIHKKVHVIDWLLEMEKDTRKKGKNASPCKGGSINQIQHARSKPGRGKQEGGDLVVGTDQAEDFIAMRNKDGLTPLTLAACLGDLKTFAHILDKTITVAWEFGDVSTETHIIAPHPTQHCTNIMIIE